MKKEVVLSNREEQVMIVLWNIEESGNKAICKDVVKILKDEFDLDFAITTVYTFLQNLVKKGYVKNEKKGVNCYTPVLSRDEYIEKVLYKINSRFFNGNKKKLINTIKSIDM